MVIDTRNWSKLLQWILFGRCSGFFSFPFVSFFASPAALCRSLDMMVVINISCCPVNILSWLGAGFLKKSCLVQFQCLHVEAFRDVLTSGWFMLSCHDDVIKWKFFPRYWPFVRGIHRSPVNSLHKDQWRGALMFNSLTCAWINDWVNNREAGDLRCHRAHYGVIVMPASI